MAQSVVAKQPILCDGKNWRIGELFDAAPDVAKRLVSQGYAEYAPKPPAVPPAKPPARPETQANDKTETTPKGE